MTGMGESRFLRALSTRVILGDGAYGTELRRRGFLPDHPYEELNRSRPEVVRDLHREYLQAGARLLKTNTFQANRLRLGIRGLGDKTVEINQAGARLAREAAGDGFVAGSVGPLGSWNEPLSVERRKEVYAEQCGALAQGECDLLLLETFMDLADLQAASDAARSTGLPVVADLAAPEGILESAARWAAGPGKGAIQVLGVNCIGPDAALGRLELLGRWTGLPRSAFPSAGLPGHELGPDAFAAGLAALAAGGACLVGGCCGAGPDHIRAARAKLGR